MELKFTPRKSSCRVHALNDSPANFPWLLWASKDTTDTEALSIFKIIGYDIEECVGLEQGNLKMTWTNNWNDNQYSCHVLSCSTVQWHEPAWHGARTFISKVKGDHYMVLSSQRKSDSSRDNDFSPLWRVGEDTGRRLYFIMFTGWQVTDSCTWSFAFMSTRERRKRKQFSREDTWPVNSVASSTVPSTHASVSVLYP